ncbi:hypothetical protein [Rhodopila sp.]|uniref:hypothetical protein n=1 Tax=Rhodopila sp. TaxID=2480087 RepID=UPI003D14136C
MDAEAHSSMPPIAAASFVGAINPFDLAYVATQLAVDRSVPLAGVLIASAIGIPMRPLFGALAEAVPKNRGAKKTAVLVAPPKFREETSKKAVRRSAAATRKMAFAGAACKRNLLRCSILSDHVLGRNRVTHDRRRNLPHCLGPAPEPFDAQGFI